MLAILLVVAIAGWLSPSEQNGKNGAGSGFTDPALVRGKPGYNMSGLANTRDGGSAFVQLFFALIGDANMDKKSCAAFADPNSCQMLFGQRTKFLQSINTLPENFVNLSSAKAYAFVPDGGGGWSFVVYGDVTVGDGNGRGAISNLTSVYAFLRGRARFVNGQWGIEGMEISLAPGPDRVITERSPEKNDLVKAPALKDLLKSLTPALRVQP